MTEAAATGQGKPVERVLTATDYRFAAHWCRLEAAKPYRAPMAPGLRAEADGYDRIADELEAPPGRS